VIADEVVHEVGNETNCICEFFWARRVVVKMAFGKYDSADWKTDCMMQCLFADHDFGAATAYIDNKCDALVRG